MARAQRMKARVHRINVEPLTEKAFKPFGELIDAKEGGEGNPINFEGGAIRMGTNVLPYKGLTFTQLEQHFHVTQSFVPITGCPAVVAVAAPTPQEDPKAIPKPEAYRVFLIDGTKGYLLKKGTWHSDRLPLYPPGIKMVIFTDDETNQDLRRYGSVRTPVDQRGGWKLNRIVDYETEVGVIFEAVL